MLYSSWSLLLCGGGGILQGGTVIGALGGEERRATPPEISKSRQTLLLCHSTTHQTVRAFPSIEHSIHPRTQYPSPEKGALGEEERRATPPEILKINQESVFNNSSLQGGTVIGPLGGEERRVTPPKDSKINKRSVFNSSLQGRTVIGA